MAERLTISEEELAAVVRLGPEQRYSYFVKKVADWESAWGLWHEGWLLLGDQNGREGFPLWPAKEYAEHCTAGRWEDYEAEEIDLGDLVGELLPKLRERAVLAAVFPTAELQGMLVEPEDLRRSLERESSRY